MVRLPATPLMAVVQAFLLLLALTQCITAILTVLLHPWHPLLSSIQRRTGRYFQYLLIIPNALGKGSDVYFHGSELDLEHIDFSDMNLDIQIENKIDCACEADPSAAEGAEDRK